MTLNTKTGKQTLYKYAVLPTLLYHNETWRTEARDIHRIHTAEERPSLL